MIHYHVVPDSLLAAENNFSIKLRASNKEGDLYPYGMLLYRKIVRENIVNVLNSVFPIFYLRLNNEEIRKLANDFVEQHHANQPEFHQIATELLLFMHQRTDLSTVEQSLIEYEWLIYALEIDESHVPVPKQVAVESLNTCQTQVKVNPTLRMVVLPFLLKDGEPRYEVKPQLHYYALYRKYDNTLFQKKLSITDVQLLQEAGNAGVMVEIMKDKAAHHINPQPLLQWLESNNNDEVISIISKG